MKTLVILNQSWSPFLPLTSLYGNNERLWVSVTHTNHMTMTTYLVMTWLPKENVNLKLWDLCETLIVYILLNTLNKYDVRRFIAWVESADWIHCLCSRPPVARFSDGLIVLRQKEMWTQTCLTCLRVWVFTFCSVHVNESTCH